MAATDRDVLLRRVLLVNLATQVLIVLTGGLVRLTGSGLGCPTWPRCVPGSYVPVVEQPQGFHKYIEFGNRALSTVVGIAALAALVAVWRWGRRDRGLRSLAAVPLVGTLAQAVLGGITVLTRLHPATVAAHFLLSMALIAACTVLLLAAAQPGTDQPVEPAPVRREIRALALATAATAAVVLVLGTVVTGSGPHSGDALEPARFLLDPRTVAWLHADAVWLFLGMVLGLLLALRLTDAGATTRRRAGLLLVVTLAQGGLGYTQYVTDLPEALVAVHMLGACLLVIAVTATLHAVLTAGRQQAGGDGAAADAFRTAGTGPAR